MKIIGIAGKAGSGKSAASRYLMTAHDYHRLAFAQPLKKMLKAVGLKFDHLYGKDKEVTCDILCGRTPRHAMQTLGTEWGRNCIHPDLWVNLWKREVEQARMYGGQPIVADDVRFQNEVDMIRQLGGVVIWLDRPAQDRVLGVTAQHASENTIESSDCNHVIRNDGRLLDLYMHIEAIAIDL